MREAATRARSRPAGEPVPLGALAALERGLDEVTTQEVEAVLHQAQHEAEAVVGAAHDDVARALAAARRAGHLAAERRAARRLAATRRAARARVLAAQRAAYDDLVAAVRSRVMALRDEDGYDALLDRLAAQASAQLGPGAVITRDPPGCGGVVAELGDRRVDYTLPALAARCVDEVLGSGEVPW